MVFERWLLISPGFRPEPRKLARHLWGNVDYDSDGNSDIDPNWTELTLTRRPEYDERIDIDPISQNPLVLEISSQTPGLALKAAEYLLKCCGGTLSSPASEQK